MRSETEPVVDVTAAVLNHHDAVLIARRKAGDPLASYWEFPGGKVEPGEDPPECLRREMREEFGIEVAVDGLLGTHIHHYPHGSIRLLVFQTRWLSGNIALHAHSEYRFVAAAELGRYRFAPADRPFVEMLAAGG